MRFRGVSRFLRARRFDPAKAQKQFADRAAWEKKYDVANLFANFPTEEFENSRRYYPRWTGRRDKVRAMFIVHQSHLLTKCIQNGLPVYVYKLSALSSGIQDEISSVKPERRYERMCVDRMSSPPLRFNLYKIASRCTR